MRPTLTSKSDRSGNDLSQRVGAGADGLKGLTRKSLREKTCALVAQLDRASDFESEGREFESLRARQLSDWSAENLSAAGDAPTKPGAGKPMETTGSCSRELRLFTRMEIS